MGDQATNRSVRRPAVRLTRLALLAAVLTTTVVLSGCSEQSRHEWKNLAMPDPASEQGEHILSLWQGAWIAAWITGAVVWGLILYVVIRYHRRSANEIPIQTRYNLPLEIFYTIAPVVMVIVFFSNTVRTQNLVLEDDTDHPPDVIGHQRWPGGLIPGAPLKHELGADVEAPAIDLDRDAVE